MGGGGESEREGGKMKKERKNLRGKRDRGNERGGGGGREFDLLLW